MPSFINTNVASLVTQHRLSVNTRNVNRSLERLASGYRINRAADDAAGMSLSDILTGQIVSSKKALQNAQDGISVLQITEGALEVIGNNLQRMRELALQAANDSNSQVQRNSIALEIRTLAEEIDRIAVASNFNGEALLDGTTTVARLQIGPNSNVITDTLDIAKALVSARIDSNDPNGGIGVIDGSGASTFQTLDEIFDFATQSSPVLVDATSAGNFVDDLDAAIIRVTRQRASIGALQNQLESISNNLNSSIVNFSQTNSQIRDLDIAAETSLLTQNQILQQASVSVLSQANSIPQMALSLLQR